MQLVRLQEQGLESKGTTKALERVTESIAKCKKAVLLVGAGISTTAGIPDFRSRDVGLYSTGSASASSTLKGPAMFSASVYSSPTTTSQHLEFLSAFKDSLDHITSSPPTATHGLMAILKKTGRLRRVYTQNIDNLEGQAGLSAVEIEGVKLQNACRTSGTGDIKGKGKAKLEGDYVQLHGSIHRVRCSSCDYVAEWTDSVENDQSEAVGQAFRRGQVAECPQCSTRAAIRAAQRKRSLPTRSFLRPAITLYEENSPAALTIGDISISDLTSGGGPDLMLVMGTSLKIPGFKKLVKEFGKAVKAKGGIRILVNREEIKGQEWKDVFDFNIVTDTEIFTNRVISDWKRTRPRDWVGQQTTLHDAFSLNKRAITATSKTKAEPAPRPPLQPLSSNTILPPLPPVAQSQRAFKIVSNNPWTTVEFMSERPSKRPRITPSPSPTKPRSTPSPFSSPSTALSTPSPSPAYPSHSPSVHDRCASFGSISPIKPSSIPHHGHYPLFQPFKLPLPQSHCPQGPGPRNAPNPSVQQARFRPASTSPAA
ncbi:hypothetical protein JCM3766R1_000527 [Sporobolomyces carnicolor]